MCHASFHDDPPVRVPRRCVRGRVHDEPGCSRKMAFFADLQPVTHNLVPNFRFSPPRASFSGNAEASSTDHLPFTFIMLNRTPCVASTSSCRGNVNVASLRSCRAKPALNRSRQCAVRVVAEAPTSEAPAALAIERTGHNFKPLRDINDIMKILPHR